MHDTVKPLYILADRKELGSEQIMDKETIAWIKRNLKPNYTKAKIFISKISPMKVDEFIKTIPREDWFHGKSQFNSIHGFNHLARTMVYIHILNLIQGNKDIRKYLIAASIHDVRRLNDKRDPSHGIRSAKWFLENKSKFKLNKSEVQEVYCMVKCHNLELNKVPRNIKDKFNDSIILLKTADALDRYRLPKKKWWPDQNRSSVELPRELLNIAKVLVIETESATIKKWSSREEIFIATCIGLGLLE